MPQSTPINTTLPEVKWGGLQKSGTKIPVTAFIGRLADMVLDAGGQYGLQIIEKYDQMQILESSAPYPWATLDIPIKYSDREESGWGRHVASAKGLGLAQNAATFDQAKGELVGKVFEVKQMEETYGEDKQTGHPIKGFVWRFVRIISGQVGVMPQAPQQQVYVPPQTVQPVPQVPQQAPPVQPPVQAGFNTQLLATDTAPIRAKKLLHGKALNEWLGAALTDDKIKADPAFTNTIFDQSFINALKASGQAILGTDGKFTVVS
jgi:hypothetical protein